MENTKTQQDLMELAQQFEEVGEVYEEQPIPMKYEGVIDEDGEGLISFDLKEYKRGVKDYSYVCGAFVALRNSGMSETSVMQWLLEERNLKALTEQQETQERIATIQANSMTI